MIARTIETLLDELSKKHGFDVEDPNFTTTDKRVAKAYEELLSGYKMDAADILKTAFPSDDYDQMVICKDIDFYSICSHHMLPFFGRVAVGYIPSKEGSVVGLSKLARITEMYARRFQIQERMTQQIANALQEHLKPRGVGVVVYDTKHLCMLMRGVKQHTSTMDTSCLLGEFREDAAVRQEFFSMIGK